MLALNRHIFSLLFKYTYLNNNEKMCQKIGTLVTPALHKVDTNFGLSTLFRFRVRSQYGKDRQTDRQTDGHDP